MKFVRAVRRWWAAYRKSRAPLHPEFRLRWECEGLVWWQNRSWGPCPPPHYKIAFTFSHPDEVSGCPFVCKIAHHASRPGKYFGIAFIHPSPPYPDESEAMIQWAKRFEEPRLLTYASEFVRNLRSNEPVSTAAWPPISRGARVVTTRANAAVTDWLPSAAASRQWGVRGEIIAHHDSHGLSYEVRHADGTIGHYDPTEIAIT